MTDSYPSARYGRSRRGGHNGGIHKVKRLYPNANKVVESHLNSCQPPPASQRPTSRQVRAMQRAAGNSWQPPREESSQELPATTADPPSPSAVASTPGETLVTTIPVLAGERSSILFLSSSPAAQTAQHESENAEEARETPGADSTILYWQPDYVPISPPSPGSPPNDDLAPSDEAEKTDASLSKVAATQAPAPSTPTLAQAPAAPPSQPSPPQLEGNQRESAPLWTSNEMEPNWEATAAGAKQPPQTPRDQQSPYAADSTITSRFFMPNRFAPLDTKPSETMSDAPAEPPAHHQASAFHAARHSMSAPVSSGHREMPLPATRRPANCSPVNATAARRGSC